MSTDTHGTVAIVDDDDAIRQSAANLLQRRGFQVRTYASGDEFLAGEIPCDLRCALIDMRMPGMNALDVMRELKARNVEARVVVLTGHGDISLAVQAMKLGASDFLTKPCAGQKLIDAIQRAIEEESAPLHRSTPSQKPSSGR